MWKWIRLPKGLALIAFLLPWLTVSCSGQPIVRASGLGLAIGQIDTSGLPVATANSNDVTANWFLLLAMAVILAGFILLFLRAASSALAVMGTSIIAFALIVIGMSRYSETDLKQAVTSSQSEPPPFDLALERLIHIDFDAGYWLALVALAAAATMAFMACRGIGFSDLGLSASAPPSAPPPSQDGPFV